MNKLSKTLIVALSVIPCVGFAQKTVEIDVKKNVHEISKYIYGTNEPYDGATATRWGGNRSSSYNWENNASNGGNDYEFISDNFYDYSVAKNGEACVLSPAAASYGYFKNFEERGDKFKEFVFGEQL